MSNPARPHPIHIVVVGDNDRETSVVAGTLARRLQRPFLDRTPQDETDPADHDERDTDTVASYARTIETRSESVVAAPSILLDQTDPPSRPDAVWMILLDDSTETGELVAGDDRIRRRADAARRLCDVRIDIGDHDTDRVVDEIAEAWEHRLTATETEHHHVR